MPTAHSAPDSETASGPRLDNISPSAPTLRQPPLLSCVAVAFGWALLAAVAFHAAYQWDVARPLVVVYLAALLQIARQEHWRLAFYPGLAVGLAIAFLRLNFFYTLFSFGAVALWIVFAVWLGFFTLLARLAFRRFGHWAALILPFLWSGLEYYRSELYYLRFAWLTPGFAFATPSWAPGLHLLGVFGLGFLIVAGVSAANSLAAAWMRVASLAALMAALAIVPAVESGHKNLQETSRVPGSRSVAMAGVQMEFPAEREVLIRLREVIRQHPNTELIVLSEYTFDGPVPKRVLDWCDQNDRYVLVGGKEPLGTTNFYNTVFVVGPDGRIVFTQVKSVPIQFMKDGLPAPRQTLWHSPWGKLAICICYDLSYTRVTDALVRQGAELLIVPTMDVIDWGKAQHELHARIAPVRAAEYRLPVFRLASSGISQYVDRNGRTLASAPSPGEGAIMAAEVQLAGPGQLPIDRVLAPVSVGLTGVLVLFFLGKDLWSWFAKKRIA